MAQPLGERDRLFGAIAVELNLVTREGLEAALRARVAGEAGSLGDILTVRHALPCRARELIDALLDEHSHQEQSTSPLTVDHVPAGILETQGHTGEADPPAARPSAGRFVVLRPHARGGLGEVLVARDEELGREVALKQIQPRYAGDAASQARFVREAEVTGGLEHPGIVPVYGFGWHPDGRPFYAMRFIRGHNLGEAVRRFHGTGPLDEGERQIEQRKLLGAFIAVCQAIGYAHSRGILHRDLKPENVMLGAFGEVLVVDWGLAKALGAADTEGGPGPTSASGCDHATQAGAALGTPAYMSPEQASGRHDLLTPASDVYGLGATLYCILTGVSPFSGGGVAEVLGRVRRGEFRRPAALAPGLPPALDAICLKAMALEPAARYPSAQALAADVERWLADEPVSAYREPFWRRAARWGRRHRTLVAGAASLLVTAVVALSVGLVVVSRERHEKALAHERAEANFRQAREAVDTYFTLVSEEELLHAPGLQPLRRKLLLSALKYYKGFEEQHRDDPALVAELASAYLRVGAISTEVGLNKEGEAALLDGARLFEQMLGAAPDEEGLLAGLARCRVALSYVRVFGGRPAEGEDAAREALPLLERLAAGPSPVGEHPRLLGRALDLIAVSRAMRGQSASAIPFSEKAVAALDGAVRASPDDAETRRLLALAYNNRATMEQLLGRLDESVRFMGQAMPHLRRLAESQPRSARHQKELARGLSTLGYQHFLLGRHAEAEKLLRVGLEGIGRLTRESPSVAEYAEVLAHTQANLGEVWARQGRPAAAAEALNAAITFWEAKRRGGLGKLDLTNLCWAHSVLARARHESGDLAAAEAACKEARAIDPKALSHQRRPLDCRERMVLVRRDREPGRQKAGDLIAAQGQVVAGRAALEEGNPGNVLMKQDSLLSELRLAELHLSAGGHAAALALIGRAIERQGELITGHPAYWGLQEQQAMAHALLGRALAARGDAAGALAAGRAAVARSETLAGKDSAYLYDVAAHRAGCIPLCGPAGSPGEGEGLAEGAVVALRQAVAAGFSNAHRLRTDPALASLRGREDFKSLVREVDEASRRGKP